MASNGQKVDDFEDFFARVAVYSALEPEARLAWRELLQARSVDKGEALLKQGEIPSRVHFIRGGLVSQASIDSDGGLAIKRFFPEGSFAASVSALVSRSPSMFSLTALEPTRCAEYDFAGFRQLVKKHQSVAAFYIAYMERHWIVEKEPLELSFRNEDAAARYKRFTREYPTLLKRLKLHEIASYLGITPTQLSRIRSQQM